MKTKQMGGMSGKKDMPMTMHKTMNKSHDQMKKMMDSMGSMH